MRLTFRSGVVIDEPVRYALAFLENDYSYRSYDSVPIARDATVTLDDIRVANRIGARMSGDESQTLFARRGRFGSALARIPPNASLCETTDDIPWDALTDLYAAADGLRGIGLAKLTKFLHKKRPELIPMLDSVVENYLRSVSPIPSRSEGLGIVAVALTRSYKTDLDSNLTTVQAVKAELAKRGYELSECRIMDIYTWAYTGETAPSWAPSLVEHPPGPDEASELASDVGVSTDGDARTALEALLAALGYVRARQVLRGWRGESQ